MLATVIPDSVQIKKDLLRSLQTQSKLKKLAAVIPDSVYVKKNCVHHFILYQSMKKRLDTIILDSAKAKQAGYSHTRLDVN